VNGIQVAEKVHLLAAAKALILSGLLSWVLLASVTHAQEWLYTVRPGDNLWNIAEEHLTSREYWKKLQILNQIADPERLPPGMKLRLPVPWLKRLPTTAKVVSVRGRVQALVAATGQTIELVSAQTLETGDAIRTGPESNVTLEFGDGSRVLVQANSTLDLKSLSTHGETNVVDTFLHLLQGRVESQVIPRPEAGSRYKISTPLAVSAVRGTHYRLGMDPGAEAARTEVLAGGVAFQGKKEVRLVGKGLGALAEAGKPVSLPSPLLPPPSTSTLPPVLTRVPIQLNLPASKGVRAYRVQIASDQRFESLLFDGVSAPPAVRGPDLPDGEYVLRLRGIDAKGLEGRDAYHPFRLHARPEPPFLIQPAHDSAVLEASLRFEWAEPERAVAYHLQVAGDDSFNPPLLDIADLSKPQWTPDRPLEPKRYYWRVAVRDSTGKKGPFGDPQSFKVQPALELQPPEVAAETMTFRWSAGLPGQQYEFQLARDKNFDDIVVSTPVSEPQLTIRRPESGFHYLRIRSIDAEGAVGPYGAAQRIDIPPASYWPVGIVVLLALVLAL